VFGMAAVRSDTGGTVGSDGTIVCKASANGVPLKRISSMFVSAGGGSTSTAVCQFKLPVKHVKLTGTISITFSGQTVTKTISAKS
jgi:hypothetical protein